MPTKPNVLWLVAEDICPDLGCYGHPDSITPNVDRLAAEGVRYTNAYSFAPVCSPARSCLITGMYPTTLGSQHLRSRVDRPEHVRCFTEYLRDDGYYCFNGFSRKEQQRSWLSDEGYQTKFDYNFTAPQPEDPLPAWDAVSGFYPEGQGAHWRNRQAGQPFFGQIGFAITHSSQYGTRHLDHAVDELGSCLPITRVRETERRDPEAVRVPSYHPDCNGVRHLWAEYHECVTEMDYQVGEILAELDRDGLSDDTIIFFFADNGMGVVGGKCWLWEQGLHVPLIIRCPERYRHLLPGDPASVDTQMVSFEDFAPTVLNLCGITPPSHMQGSPFLDDEQSSHVDREYVYGIRDRIDHCPEVIRTVRSRNFQYVRNLTPHYGWNYSLFFWKKAPWAFADWASMAKAGGLKGRQQVFFQESKPAEELYDLTNDPDQMQNLVNDPDIIDILQRMRAECDDWMIRTRDLGLLSEFDLHERSKGSTPFEMGLDAGQYPVRDVLGVAKLAGERDSHNVPHLRRHLAHPDSAVRRWAAIGLGSLGSVGQSAEHELRDAANDTAPHVRIAAAEALVNIGLPDEGLPVLLEGLQHESGLLVFEVLWALQRIGEEGRPIVNALRDIEIHPREKWLDPEQGPEPHLPAMFNLVTQLLDPTAPQRQSLIPFEDVDLAMTQAKYFD